MILTGRSEQLGAYVRVEVEIPLAYTDGSSRLDWVWVAVAAMQGDEDSQLAAVAAAMDVKPVKALRGLDVQEWKQLRDSGVARPFQTGALKRKEKSDA